jgi:hypothetical protein
VSVTTGTGEELVQLAAGKAPVTLDSVAGAVDATTVALVPAS